MKGSRQAFSITLIVSITAVVIGHPHPPCDSTSGGATIIVEFNPETFLLVTEGLEGHVNATISGIVGNITISTSSGDPTSFESLFNETVITFADVDAGNVTVMIPIRGRKLSISSLELNITHVYQVAEDHLLAGEILSSGDGGNPVDDAQIREYIETESFTYVIKVSRKRGVIEKVFTYSLLAWLIISYITMGSKMDLTVIWTKLRRPYGVLTGIACQFVLMPLIAFALASSPGITPETAIGLLVVGSCPGGWISNVFSLLMDVDFVLSLTMTFCSSFMALGMMPLNMFIYGSKLAGDSSADLQTPYKDIVLQLGLMLIPVGLGMYVTQKSEKLAKFFLKCLKPMACGLIVIALSIGIPSQLYAFNTTWRVYAISFALPFLGGGLGFVISKFFRRPNVEALTISFETGVQNSLLAMTVTKLSYNLPEADLIGRMPLLVAIMQMLQGSVMILTYVIVRRVLIRVGKLARPDTGDYQQCDVEAKAGDDTPVEDAKEGDKFIHDETRRLKTDDDFELKMDSCDKNGYVKMNEEKDVAGEKSDGDDDVTKAGTDSDSDVTEGYVKLKEDAVGDIKPEEVTSHPSENTNNNSCRRLKKDSTNEANGAPENHEAVPNDAVEDNGAETVKSPDQPERETSI